MNHAWEALGWTLIHFCWQAAGIAVVYGLADMAAVKARIQTRYLLSLGALLSMLAVSLATLSYEASHHHDDLSLWTGAPAVGSLSLMPVASGAGGTLAKQPAHLHWTALMPWLDLAWLLGVISFSVRTIGGWWWLQRLRRAAFREAPVVLEASFARVRRRLGITRSVQLRISEFVSGPLTIGVLRSLVLLPASALLALSPEQLEVVLAHELAHLQRADYVWNLLQTAVETIFFFHPAVWWVGRRTRQYRELCCDDIALRCCSDPLVYATALLRMEEQRNRQAHLAMALGGHPSRQALRLRIARILGEALPAKNKVRPLPLAVLCAGVALLLLPLPQLVAGARLQAAGPAPRIEPLTSPIPILIPAGTPVRLELLTRRPQPTPLAQLQPLKRLTPLAQLKPLPPLPPLPPWAPITLQISNLPQIAQLANSLTLAQLATLQVVGRLSAIQKTVAANSSMMQDASAAISSGNKDYIDRMRAAGYDLDLDKYAAMKIQGITPEYAGAIAAAGLGKPSADDLIAMKVEGVTPDYISKLHAAGIQPRNIGDLVAYRIFNVTPEFIGGMRSAGFTSVSAKDALALRAQGVTPEYAKAVKRQLPDATVQDLVKLRIFRIDDAFIASAKRHGLTPLTVEKLVRIRISGVLDDDGQEGNKR